MLIDVVMVVVVVVDVKRDLEKYPDRRRRRGGD
jgi:hypothetical protein